MGAFRGHLTHLGLELSMLSPDSHLWPRSPGLRLDSTPVHSGPLGWEFSALEPPTEACNVHTCDLREATRTMLEARKR